MVLVLSVSAGAAASDTSRAIVNTEATPIYAETSRSSAVMKKLAKGETVTIAYTVATGEGDWWFRAWNLGGPLLVWVTVILTVYSGLGYAWRHRDVIAPDQ